VVMSGDDQQPARFEALPGKARQEMGGVGMLNHFGGDNRIKQAFLGSDQGRSSVQTQLVEVSGGHLLPAEPHAIGIGLHPQHIKAMGLEKMAEGAVATAQIKKPCRLLSKQKIEQGRIDVTLRVRGGGATPAVLPGGAQANARLQAWIQTWPDRV